MIVFTKDLLTINNAYNDSILEFSSNRISATTATISVSGVTFNTAAINGVFTFNLKEVVKHLINTNHFEDTIMPNLVYTWVYTDMNITKSIPVSIIVTDGTRNETVINVYKFIRAVAQLPNYSRMYNIKKNYPIRVLLPTKNYIDYYVKYFEGFPFDFGIEGIANSSTFHFKNITTNQLTTKKSSAGGVTRIFLSDGGLNLSESDLLVQSSSLNKVELYVNNAFVANIYIHKIESDCGVYLKWLNSNGSYSYWKFDNAFKSTITPKLIDDFNGKLDNLQNLTATNYLIGKTAIQTMSVQSIYTDKDAAYLSDLVTSPLVQMYVHNSPFQKMEIFDFIGVKVSDTAFTVLDSKKSKSKVSLTITLPAINTITN